MADEEQIILPVGYKRVEYLESTGTQFIATDYYPKAGQKYIDMDVSFINKGTWTGNKTVFFASEYGNPNGAYDVAYGCSLNFGGAGGQNKELYFWIGGDTNSNNTAKVFLLSDKTLFNRNHLTIWGNYCTYGTQLAGIINGGTRDSKTPLTIFGGNGVPFEGHGMRLYEFRMGTYSNDKEDISLHLLPCLDASSRPCMFDMKSGKTYYNNGTGEFLVGEIIIEETFDIPDRFKKVEYLQSKTYAEGTYFIDTGVKPNQNIGFYIDFEMLNESSANTAFCIFGSRNASSNKDFQLSRYSNGILRFGTNHQIATPFNRHNRYKSSLKNGVYTHVDGTTYTLPSTPWDGNYTIYLFSLNNANSCIQGGASRIFRFKLYDGDNLIKDFIPAYDTYKASFCMYDLINKKPHYVEGSGVFESDYDPQRSPIKHHGILHKLPEGFTKLKYLISNGYQYIDTNYIPTNETGYYVEGQGYTTSETYYFGLRENTSTNSRIYACATPNVNWGWMTYGTLTNAAANLRQETKFYHNFLNSRVSKATINETDFTYNLPELDFTPTLNVYLFNYNNAGVPHAACGLKGRIDTFLISEGDQIVRQFIPCLDENDIPCMYELYTGTVHYSQGSSQFSYPRKYTNDPINLPAGYTKCVYLQSNGTQWIDTEVIPTDDTGVYIKAQHLSYGDHPPIGSWESANNYYYPPRFNLTNKSGSYSFGTTYQSSFYYDKGDDLVFTSTMNLYNDRTVNFWSEDTNWFGIIPVNFTATFTRPLWLFSYNMDNATINATYGKFGGRIFRAKITQGDYLVHDFVPCLDSDNRPCMYDLVTQEPYYNQSGGEEFAYCVEHQLPSDFIKLKYLESTGTQIIKTGIIPTDSTGIYVDAYHTKYNGDTDWSVIGLRNTNGNTYFTVGRVQRDTNGAGFGWGAFTAPGGNGNVRYEASLNFLNDRKAIITAPAFAQRINALETLAFTPTKDLYMFGMNNYDGAATVYSTYRIYRAKISEGSEIVRDWVPAMDNRNSKPCMYDLINNVAYYNDGEGDFVMPPKREGSYTGFAQLGGIGNRLGSNAVTVSEDSGGENNGIGTDSYGTYLTLSYVGEEYDWESVDVLLSVSNKSISAISIKFMRNYSYGDTDNHTVIGVQPYTDAYESNGISVATQPLAGDNPQFSLNCSCIMDDSVFWSSDYYYNVVNPLVLQEVHIDVENKISTLNGIIREMEDNLVFGHFDDDNYYLFSASNCETKIYEVIFYDEDGNMISKMTPRYQDEQKGMYCSIRNIFLPAEINYF